jgi:hypothetical protein
VTWTSERGRLAATVRHNPDADVSEIRRDLRAARLEDAIRKAVDAAPPLSPEQRAKLAGLLHRDEAAA